MPAAVNWVMDAGISMPSVIGEIVGPYVEFAEMVRQIVGDRSLRQAQIKTGVSHTTIGDMMKGIRPKEATIRLFAAGFDTASEDLLKAAGYPARSHPAIPRRETAPVPSPAAHEVPPARYDPTQGEEQTPAAPGGLEAYGEIVDPRPYLYALERVHEASAGNVERLVAVDAPTSDLRPPKAHLVTAVLVKGTCMEPYAKDGETVLVLPPETVADGCIVTATVDVLNIVCKRIRVVEGTSWLETQSGEGRIPEGRFVVTGVLAHVIRSLLPQRQEEKEKK